MQNENNMRAGEAGQTHEECERLLKLVGELVAANQELRDKVARLEMDLESTECGLARACQAYALLMP